MKNGKYLSGEADLPENIRGGADFFVDVAA